jgi:hypothetical protein
MRCTEAGSGSESARASAHDPRVRTSALALMQPGRFWTVFCFVFFFPSVRSRRHWDPLRFQQGFRQRDDFRERLQLRWKAARHFHRGNQEHFEPFQPPRAWRMTIAARSDSTTLNDVEAFRGPNRVTAPNCAYD